MRRVDDFDVIERPLRAQSSPVRSAAVSQVVEDLPTRRRVNDRGAAWANGLRRVSALSETIKEALPGCKKRPDHKPDERRKRGSGGGSGRRGFIPWC